MALTFPPSRPQRIPTIRDVDTVYRHLEDWRTAVAVFGSRRHTYLSTAANTPTNNSVAGSNNLLLNSLFREMDFRSTGSTFFSSQDQTGTLTMILHGGDGNWSTFIWERRVLPSGAYSVVGAGDQYSETFTQG